MWTVGQIAARDGISKQAVSKSVRTLAERHGLTVERSAQGAISAVNVAEYDHLRGRFADPSKAQAPRQAPERPDLKPSETYDEALRQKTWHEAEKRRLELDEIKGALVRRDRLTDAILRVAGDIERAVDRLPGSADELANAVAKDGTHGLRVALKRLSADLRDELASALEAIAAAAPDRDDDRVVEKP